jgi:hypothetical protein
MLNFKFKDDCIVKTLLMANRRDLAEIVLGIIKWNKNDFE